MNLLRRVLRIAGMDAGLLRAFPRLRLSLAGIVLIPALYAYIYLESVWDPASRTGLLEATIVNLDQGSEVGGQAINIGKDLVATLRERRIFDFQDDADPQQARKDVREGRRLFALIIPPDFSASAMTATAPGAGKVIVYMSEGNNYAGAGFARRFARELALQMNDTLAERRWELVLGKASESADSLTRTREVVARLQAGAAATDAGVQRAQAAASQVATGAQSLADGSAQAVALLNTYASSLSAIGARLPTEGAAEALADGGRSLAVSARELQAGLQSLRAGSSQVAAGVTALQSALPPALPLMAGTSKGLAHSIEPQLEVDAPVATNGMGFLPNFIPVALWLGAALVPFIFHLRRLPEAAAQESPAVLLLGKLAVFVPINLVQALFVFAMCAGLLGLHPVHAAGLALTMVVSAVTFMLIIVLLFTALGDVGKALALVLVILQLSSAGGIVPIELTNDFFAAISNWMPFTWAIRAVRASAFDAFGGQWVSSLGVLSLFGLVAFLVTLRAARWRFVPAAEHRPAVEL